MTRRTHIETIPAGDANVNRDQGRTYIITEMSAFQAEDLAVRVLLALANAGIDVPDSKTGMAGLAAAGMDALKKLPYATAKPILDEIRGFMMYQHKPGQAPMALSEDNLEEVTTLIALRKAFLVLHLGFLKAGNTLITG